jgi:predicted glycoside hydrolase/deacetylase ChbG (UPF0249 family)
MRPNPALKKLGFADDDRLVILHCDDLGMCQATLSAGQELAEAGLVSSYGAMVPCSWFPSVAAWYRDNPDLDIGVHLTLTCEWDRYRWGPLSTRDRDSGLIDDEGYFYRDNEGVQKRASEDSVLHELRAQIEQAKTLGMEPTHIDTHMGTVVHERFFPLFIQVAQEYRLPLLMFRSSKEQLLQEGWNEAMVDAIVKALATLEDQGFPLLDDLTSMPLEEVIDPESRLALAKQKFSELPPGITHFLFHAASDTPELRAIAPDWRGRVADLQLFTSPELRYFIKEQGIHIIGYRALRDLLRE